jgi:hypothetical protein
MINLQIKLIKINIILFYFYTQQTTIALYLNFRNLSTLKSFKHNFSLIYFYYEYKIIKINKINRNFN